MSTIERAPDPGTRASRELGLEASSGTLFPDTKSAAYPSPVPPSPPHPKHTPGSWPDPQQRCCLMCKITDWKSNARHAPTPLPTTSAHLSPVTSLSCLRNVFSNLTALPGWLRTFRSPGVIASVRRLGSTSHIPGQTPTQELLVNIMMITPSILGAARLPSENVLRAWRRAARTVGCQTWSWTKQLPEM